MNDLKKKAKGLTEKKGIPFMEGAEKGDVMDLTDSGVVTIRDYAFLTGDDGQYLVFRIEEEMGKFYFGGKVLTETFQQFTEDEYTQILEEGIPLKLFKKKSKKGRSFIAVEFYPE